ncbi:TnsD family Tn7-like transposition protein [Clostridium sp. DJ247]|uniref:TnsD family Tn7-like transposition protein n=1 Tax=Clostridium sp. DJ247 TaxID=2726188 RepID=UPI001623605C|nr:TnsD family Tn7-like transposition protein [Clostridium sp. DJ247]MBC2582780.1 hypothetical protein [Clostridium sp. DJ247]
MINFPTPYPNELLYSVYARYHFRSGNLNYESTLKDLFGKVIHVSGIEFSFAINRLLSNLPIGSRYNAKDFIQNNTLYPFYSAFLPKENADTIYSLMLSDIGTGLQVKSGILTSGIKKNEYLRFCPECFMEDIVNYGETFWHRNHQIPGLIVCSKHKCFLKDSKVSTFIDIKRGYFTANEENCIDDLDCFDKLYSNGTYQEIEGRRNLIKHDVLDRSIKLSEGVEYLLNHKIKNQEIQFFINKYIDALKSISLTTDGGFIYPEKLQEAFLKYHGEAFLEMTQSNIDIENGYNWLRLFLRKNKSIRHPIRHLLFCQFAGINLEGLFNYNQLGTGRVASKVTYEPYRKKEDVRREWLKLIEENPGKSRGELSELSKGNHIWLLRYDKEWYNKVSPKRKKMIVPENKKDWNKSDKEILSIVIKAVNEMLASKEKPIRIRKGSIIRYIANDVRIKSLEKLPLTREYINSVTETLDAYRERKMKWAIQESIEEGHGVTMWKVIRKMGIGVKISEEFKEKVVKEINNFDE